MGFTRVEFLRILPAALHDYPYTQEHDCIQVTVDGKLLTITLGEEQVRRIAMLALPWIPVEFDYSRIGDVPFQTFLRQFDLYYRKGGG
ncbi:MAG: hypothetical protein KJ914_03095 [Gammaproteobacteria bacterium]|nr:hypothetical protein [Gammaproteobacteria bacterium]MBU1725672.1 hypothetical protein [Gammaproteobacteria bacterium]MBU2003976.1 hypothetical protein [Gammaproteobacteria bacterium]